MGILIGDPAAIKRESPQCYLRAFGFYSPPPAARAFERVRQITGD